METTCTDTTNGHHDWLPFDRPASTHLGDTVTTTAPAMAGRVCHWCGEVDYRSDDWSTEVLDKIGRDHVRRER